MGKVLQMSITLRRGTLKDAKQCGEICYRAFKAVAEQHNFPPDFPSPQVAVTLLSELLAHPMFTELSPNLTVKSLAATLPMNVRSLLALAQSQSIRPCKIARLDAS
jgi:hypothetical protein